MTCFEEACGDPLQYIEGSPLMMLGLPFFDFGYCKCNINSVEIIL